MELCLGIVNCPELAIYRDKNNLNHENCFRYLSVHSIFGLMAEVEEVSVVLPPGEGAGAVDPGGHEHRVREGGDQLGSGGVGLRDLLTTVTVLSEQSREIHFVKC